MGSVADHSGVVDVVVNSYIGDLRTAVDVVVGSFDEHPKEQEECAGSVVVAAEVKAVAIHLVVAAVHNIVADCRGVLMALVEVVTDGMLTAVVVVVKAVDFVVAGSLRT